MANKLLLCISLNETTAARWRYGRLTDCTVFENSEAGIAEFKNYAAASGDAPVFVLVDAIEEDYRVETLPHASGSDRAQMVERKLRQYYRGSPYSAASLIGRDTSKRRDDRFMFSALTNADIVDPWLAVLAECSLPVGGVFLLPMVISGLVEVLGEKANNVLLVSVQPAGIRLTFFRGGTFRLSRLSRNEAGADARDRAVIDEISNTRLYLHALRAATLDEAVSIVLLDHAGRLESTAQAIHEDNASVHCTRVDPARIAALLKIDPGLLGISPAIVYLQLLGMRTPGSDLAPAKVTAGFQRYRSRRQLFAASAVVAAVGIVWCGYNLWDQLSLKERADEAAIKTARVNAEYQAATGKFPTSPTSADNLRMATELAEKLRAAVITPDRFMQVIGSALSANPQIMLREFAWQNRKGEFEGATAATGAAAPPLPPGTVAGKPRQGGQLTGQVVDFKGDFRNAINSINALADQLRRDPAVESVRIVQLPLNVSPTLSLSGSTSDNPAQAGSAEFKMIVVLRPST